MRLLREAGLYVFVAVAAYLLISLWTYSASDPAWSHRGPITEVVNVGGRAGAWIADVLLNVFGFAAYLFPVMIGFAGVRMYARRREPALSLQHKTVISTGFLLVVLGGCGLASLHFAQASSGMPFGSGGWVGHAVAAALVSAFSFVGATIFLLALFLSGVTLFTGLSWLWLMDIVGHVAYRLGEHATQFASLAIDRVIGARAKRKRREAVSQDEKVLNERPAPRIEPVLERLETSVRAEREKQVPLFEIPGGSELPPLSLLDAPDVHKPPQFSKQSLESVSRLLEKKLLDFNIEIQVVEVHPGPVITRFEVEPAAGVKAAQITNLARDLARSLSVVSLRVVENIPGKTTVGIEVPNEYREIVRLSEVLSSEAYDSSTSPLALSLGKDISGNPVVVDLSRMPHLLIAGTTGSGKSVCLNSLVLSLIYKSAPEHVRFIMIDPKMLELAVYEGIPHLLTPVVTDMKQAANAFRWALSEMQRRYQLMAALGVRNIGGYNRKISEAEEKGEAILNPLVPSDEEAQPLTSLPHVVILVDELADLMLVVGKKIEELVVRLAQRARAAGIHLILATQRPSVDVITGLIKANVPCRVAFQMASRVDSRTVLDQMGAEQLLGQGDMLFLQPGLGVPMRVHGTFVSDQEVHKIARFLKKGMTPVYDENILLGDAANGEEGEVFVPGLEGNDVDDPLYDEALRIVTESRRASISGVQRRLRIGYNRAARLIEQMEKAGIVGPLQSNGSREVLAPAPREPDAIR
ncbi:MAG: DNA translocase FtsK [Acidiferrobacterales bacterium]